MSLSDCLRHDFISDIKFVDFLTALQKSGEGSVEIAIIIIEKEWKSISGSKLAVL